MPSYSQRWLRKTWIPKLNNPSKVLSVGLFQILMWKWNHVRRWTKTGRRWSDGRFLDLAYHCKKMVTIFNFPTKTYFYSLFFTSLPPTKRTGCPKIKRRFYHWNFFCINVYTQNHNRRFSVSSKNQVVYKTYCICIKNT